MKGRRTGRPHTVALLIAGYEGEHYLLSMLGECEWVKNGRASGEAHIISGRRRKVKLEEVPIERRASIINEYIRLALGRTLSSPWNLYLPLITCSEICYD